MKLLFATANPGKLKEARMILAPHEVEQLELGMFEPHELGHEAIVRSKARQALAKANAPVFVEDTALYFEAFNDFPGVYAKFVVDGIKIEGILKLLEGKGRKARFETLVAYAEPNKEVKVFKGVCNGSIAECEKGEERERLPYDRVFIPEGFEKTFSEMTRDEKNALSHRNKALLAFAEELK